jgi:hypothetical protein
MKGMKGMKGFPINFTFEKLSSRKGGLSEKGSYPS